jgi:cysteine-rich repeat protein
VKFNLFILGKRKISNCLTTSTYLLIFAICLLFNVFGVESATIITPSVPVPPSTWSVTGSISLYSRLYDSSLDTNSSNIFGSRRVDEILPTDTNGDGFLSIQEEMNTGSIHDRIITSVASDLVVQFYQVGTNPMYRYEDDLVVWRTDDLTEIPPAELSLNSNPVDHNKLFHEIKRFVRDVFFLSETEACVKWKSQWWLANGPLVPTNVEDEELIYNCVMLTQEIKNALEQELDVYELRKELQLVAYGESSVMDAEFLLSDQPVKLILEDFSYKTATGGQLRTYDLLLDIAAVSNILGNQELSKFFANDSQGEQCDDGNNVSGDGCDKYCRSEGGIKCGDGILQIKEGCDDGNIASGDGCDSFCQIEGNYCGDGEVQIFEGCDEGRECPDGRACANSDQCIIEYPPNSGEYTAPGVCKVGRAFRNRRCSDASECLSLSQCLIQPNQDIGVCSGDPNGTLCESNYDCTSCTNEDIWGECYTTGEECRKNEDCPSEYCVMEFENICRARTYGGVVQRSVCDENCQFEMFCGDRIVYLDYNGNIEHCDPGFHCANGDSCYVNADCEDASACIMRSVEGCTSSCQVQVCGNGFEEGIETCDDGKHCEDGISCVTNSDCNDGSICEPRSNDGCNSNCQDEYCGDGEVGPNEECDNGGVCDNGASCDRDIDCPTEYSYCHGYSYRSCDTNNDCPRDSECVPQNNASSCNSRSEDGCSIACIVEFCGDGFIQNGLGETCDDGMVCSRWRNACTSDDDCSDDEETCGPVGMDGCSAECVSEFCGDTVTQSFLGEQCDDGKHCADGTSCIFSCADSSTCEPRDTSACLSSCLRPPPPPPPPPVTCGDGNVEGDEECDDGNTDNGDGCDENCLEENGGNCRREGNEECDDGVALGDDACDGNEREYCGDGDINGWPDDQEECDDGSYCFGGMNDGQDCTDNSDLCAERQCVVMGVGNVCGVWSDPGRCIAGTNPSEWEIVCCGDSGECCDYGEVGCVTTCNGECAIPEGVCLSSCREAQGCPSPCDGSCGDGCEDSGEECDDGNDNDLDDCGNDCKENFCGDGEQQPLRGEVCDPGKTCGGVYGGTSCENNSDCNSNRACLIVRDHPTCSNYCKEIRCGDCVRNFPQEECDDGNLDDNDGCNSICMNEYCGDGIPQPDEACDDGGVCYDGSSCAVESPSTCQIGVCTITDAGGGGWCTDDSQCGAGTCSVSAADCESNPCNGCTDRCAPISCGDGIVECNEECDDGNLDNGDGCNVSCMWEFCGDGTYDADGGDNIVGTEDDEKCDSGWGNNDTVADACRTDCTNFRCGDSVVDSGEQCDMPTCPNGLSCISDMDCDGTGPMREDERCVNRNDYNGCDSSCQWDYCGDGFVNYNAGEECDDGNVINGDGCSSACLPDMSLCGNGVWDDYGGDGISGTRDDEECDYKDPDESLMTCTTSCTRRINLCGNGYRDFGEQCDDGNTSSSDGCSQECELENPDLCGNGKIDPGETCDQMHSYRTVECDSYCQLPNPAPYCGDGRKDLSGIWKGDVFGRILRSIGGYNLDFRFPDGSQVLYAGLQPAILNVGFLDEGWSAGGWYITPRIFESRGNPPVSLLGDKEVIEGDSVTVGKQSCLTCGNYINESDEECDNGRLTEGYYSFDRAPYARRIRSLWVASGSILPTDVLDDLEDYQLTPYGLPWAVLKIVEELMDFDSEGWEREYKKDYCSEDCELSYCGNGKIDPGETCEDTNLLNGKPQDGDGCSSECFEEGGFNPFGPYTCGDDVLSGFEECDDGGSCTTGTGMVISGTYCRIEPGTTYCDANGWDNISGTDDDQVCVPASGDGCSNWCEVEPHTICGNKEIEPYEECDTGGVCVEQGSSLHNNLCGDPGACLSNSDCPIGLECDMSLGTNPNTGRCRGTVCAIDDDCPNDSECHYVAENQPWRCGIARCVSDGDCSSGEACVGYGGNSSCNCYCVYNNPTECKSVYGYWGTDVYGGRCIVDRCGNGKIDRGEQCDDGNRRAFDGCSQFCLIEEVCGNSELDRDLFEECDDGNVFSDDGCSPDCLVEYCGDGVLQPGLGEECDEGVVNNSNIPGASCNRECELPKCGDGIKQENAILNVWNGETYYDDYSYTEHCDPGMHCENSPNAYCIDDWQCPYSTCDEDTWMCTGDWSRSCARDEDCQMNVCKVMDEVFPGLDGILCTADCTEKYEEYETENPWLCGNGVVDSSVFYPEECDDGNLINNDGCSERCEVEERSCNTDACSSSTTFICEDGSGYCRIENGNQDCPRSTCVLRPECALECVFGDCGNGTVDPGEQCDDGRSCSHDSSITCSDHSDCDAGGCTGGSIANGTTGTCSDDSYRICMSDEDCRSMCLTASQDGCSSDCRFEIPGEEDSTLDLCQDGIGDSQVPIWKETLLMQGHNPFIEVESWGVNIGPWSQWIRRGNNLRGTNWWGDWTNPCSPKSFNNSVVNNFILTSRCAEKIMSRKYLPDRQPILPYQPIGPMSFQACQEPRAELVSAVEIPPIPMVHIPEYRPSELVRDIESFICKKIGFPRRAFIFLCADDADDLTPSFGDSGFDLLQRVNAYDESSVFYETSISHALEIGYVVGSKTLDNYISESFRLLTSYIKTASLLIFDMERVVPTETVCPIDGSQTLCQ